MLWKRPMAVRTEFPPKTPVSQMAPATAGPRTPGAGPEPMYRQRGRQRPIDSRQLELVFGESSGHTQVF